MLICKLKKYISLLLVLVLICMVLPDTSISEKYLDAGITKKVSFIFSASFVHTDIVSLAPNCRKTTFHSVSAEIYDCLIEHICFADMSQSKFIYYEAPTDYRKELMKTILHYIHGSKYKDGASSSEQWV